MRPPKGLRDRTGAGASFEPTMAVYLKQISKHKPMKSEEEAETSKRVRRGDKRAIQRLANANLRFVVSVARNYQNQGMSLADLVNEGNLGLIRAVKRFDPDKGYKFISYAVWWIRQAMLSALADQSRIIRMPLNRVSMIHKVGVTAAKLQQKLNRPPSPEEISKNLRVEIDLVYEAMRIGNRHSSLDAPLRDGENATMLDYLEDKNMDSPDAPVEDISLSGEINKILETLTEREADIIKLYFGIGCETAHTLEDIGLKYQLTRERIRQIKEKAFRRLKHASRNKKLRHLVP